MNNKKELKQLEIKVSCITVTTEDRIDFNNRIMRIFSQQDYPNKEHIVLYGSETIGQKKNIACGLSNGEIIVFFDSDDLFASDYISKCVEQLQECDCTGLDNGYFTDGVQAWMWEWKGNQKLVLGSGMALWKRVWERNKFKHVSSGEDTIFCANAGKIIPHGYVEGFVATIHQKNTASHHALPFMKKVPLSEVPMLEQVAFQ